MSKFTFIRGEWQDGNPLPEWEENEDYDDYLEKVGYPRTARAAIFGHEDGGNIEVFEAEEGSSFLANISPSGGVFYEVYLPDLPSFMMFIKDYGTVLAAESINTTQQQLLALNEKLFRAQHGHSYHGVCKECDPDGWETHMKWRASQKQN